VLAATAAVSTAPTQIAVMVGAGFVTAAGQG
jgi:hypothetical protein